MDLEYYKEYYYLERSHWWFLVREKIILSHIELLIRQKKLIGNKISILNIGCGTGRSSEYLSMFGEVTSVEYDKFCCEFTEKKTGLNIINGSITELPFENNTFDLVCAFDVIEHVENDALAVSEMKRVCKFNGINIVTVPAFMSLWSNHDVINHHYRRYKLNEIKKIYKQQNQGEILFNSYFNFFLFVPIFLARKLSNILKLENKQKNSGSDFNKINNSFINKILYAFFYTESLFLKAGINYPFGVSILLSWRKNN